jgi:hypothetical protein
MVQCRDCSSSVSLFVDNVLTVLSGRAKAEGVTLISNWGGFGPLPYSMGMNSWTNS